MENEPQALFDYQKEIDTAAKHLDYLDKVIAGEFDGEVNPYERNRMIENAKVMRFLIAHSKTLLERGLEMENEHATTN